MTFIPLDANLRPFGAPPSKGRRENTASQTPHTDGFRYENAASPHSSFRAKARNLFRSRQGKGCERNGKRETPYSLRPPKTVFHADRSTQEKEHGKLKRSLGSARDDDTRMPLPSCDFQSSAMPTSAPSGHLLPWEGGRIPPHGLPMKKTYDTRMPLPLSSFRARSSKASASDSTVSRIVISSESEKSFSFAVKKGCERSGQWETLCSLRPEKTLFHAGRFMQENEEKSISNRR